MMIPEYRSDRTLRQLSLRNLNGWEIKNAVKMASTWRNYKGCMLTVARVENSIKATTGSAAKDAEVDIDLYE